MTPPTIQAATGMIPGVFVPLWALLHCFFGYVLFRVTLAINGLVGGFFLGAYVMGLIRQEPTVRDVWIAGTVGAVLLMLMAWFLYRAIFTLAVGLGAMGLVLRCWPGPPIAATWIVAALLGAVAAAVIALYLRELVAMLTAVLGAAGVVIVVVDQWLWQGIPQEWLGRDMPLTLGALVAFLLLAAAGLAVQIRTQRLFPTRFAPPNPRQRKQNSGHPGVRPKFTKV